MVFGQNKSTPVSLKTNNSPQEGQTVGIKEVTSDIQDYSYSKS